MSVICIEPTYRSYESTTRRLPPEVYRRRRVVAALASAALVLLASAGVVLLAGLGSDPASASETRPAPTATAAAMHVAQPGDTLWAIADRYRGDVGRDRYLDALIALNGGTRIQVGQAVALP